MQPDRKRESFQKRDTSGRSGFYWKRAARPHTSVRAPMLSPLCTAIPTARRSGTESLEGGGYNEVDPTYAYYMYQGRGMCNEVGGSRCSRFAQSHSSARWVECLVSGATRGTITYIRKIVDGSRFAIFLLLFSKKKVIIKIREGNKDLPYCALHPFAGAELCGRFRHSHGPRLDVWTSAARWCFPFKISRLLRHAGAWVDASL